MRGHIDGCGDDLHIHDCRGCRGSVRLRCVHKAVQSALLPCGRNKTFAQVHLGISVASGDNQPVMGPHPPLRLVRAAVFSAVCGSLTLFAHASSSHTPVPPWAMAAGFGMVLGMATVLAGHERSLATILGGLLSGQFVLHVLFNAAQPHAVAHPAHGGTTVDLTPVAQNGTGMTLAHLAAAALSAWWLWHGERAVWSLARRVAALAAWSIRRVFAFLGAMPVTGPMRILAGTVTAPRPARAALRHSVVLRAPPHRTAASRA